MVADPGMALDAGVLLAMLANWQCWLRILGTQLCVAEIEKDQACTCCSKHVDLGRTLSRQNQGKACL